MSWTIMRTSRPVAQMLALAALTLSGCGDDSTESTDATATTAVADATTAPAEMDDVRIQISTNNVAFLDGLAAIDIGAFARHGIEPELLPYANNGAVAALQVATGEADFVLTPPGATLATIAAGRDLRIIAAGALTPTASLVLHTDVLSRLAEDGVTPESPLDDRLLALRGLSINAGSPGSPLLPLLRTAAADAGLDPETDLEIVTSSNATPSGLLAQLTSGQIDGLLTSPPSSVQPVIDGLAEVWLSGPAGELGDPGYYITWATSLDIIRDQPDLVDRFIAAVEEAHDAIATDTESVVSALRPRFSDFSDDLFAASVDQVVPAYVGTELEMSRLETAIAAYNEGAESRLDPNQEIADPRLVDG